MDDTPDVLILFKHKCIFDSTQSRLYHVKQEYSPDNNMSLQYKTIAHVKNISGNS